MNRRGANPPRLALSTRQPRQLAGLDRG